MDYGAIVSAVVGANADLKAGKITAQQFDLLKKQMADMAGIPLPELEHVVAQHLGPSAMSGIQRDDGLRAKQLQSLGSLQDIVDSGGMTLGDRADEEAALGQANQADHSRRLGIQNDLASRGQLDSGNALVSANMSAQSAANQGRAAGMESAANAQKRRLQALNDIGEQAGHLRGQDFGEASAKASAQDAIDKWNAGAAEKSAYYNAGLPQQQFNNRMTKITGQQAGVNNLSAAYGNEAQGVRNQGAAAGQAAGAAVNSGVASYHEGLNGGAATWTPEMTKDASGERGGYADISKDDPDFK